MAVDNFSQLADGLIPAIRTAGQMAMDLFGREIAVLSKADDSPVTRADRAVEAVILAKLATLAPDIPVIAEEAVSAGHVPRIGERFFLVDPLDGTAEFINKSGEFTINIALVEKGGPVFGLIYAPALRMLYVTAGPDVLLAGPLCPRSPAASLHQLDLKKVAPRPSGRDSWVIVASKSHMTPRTQEFIDRHDRSQVRLVGSSLKFCLLANGEADLYPRFGPTMEWDTAAGQAVLQAAGGEVLVAGQTPLDYGHAERNFANPDFVARGAAFRVFPANGSSFSRDMKK